MLKLPELKTKVIGAIAGIVALIVMLICWQLWKPRPPTPEKFMAAHRQGDGSLVLEKRPDAAARPPHQIPKGATLERQMRMTVQPRAVFAPASSARKDHVADAGKMISCPPVTVDLSLVRNPDDTRSVVASSPDGKVIGGVDIPVEAAKPAPAPKLWAAGALWNPFKQTFGVWLDRDIGFVRVGGELLQEREGSYSELGGAVKVGIRF